MNQEYGPGFEFLAEGFPDLAPESGEREPQPAIGNRVETDTDPYKIAKQVASDRITQKKDAGLLNWATMLDEDTSDDHFDDLRDVYRQVHAELNLPWPQPTDQS